jgi:hypothetical protein
MARVMLGNYASIYTVVAPKLVNTSDLEKDLKKGFQFVKYYSGSLISLLDANSGEFVRNIDTYSSHNAIFSNSGKFCYIPQNNDDSSYIRDGVTFEKILRLIPTPKDPVNPMFNHHGNMLAVPEMEGSVNVYNSFNGKLLYKLAVPRGAYKSAYFSTNDSFLITVGSLNNIGFWYAINGKRIQDISNPNPNNYYRDIPIDPDMFTYSNQLIIQNTDKNIQNETDKIHPSEKNLFDGMQGRDKYSGKV